MGWQYDVLPNLAAGKLGPASSYFLCTGQFTVQVQLQKLIALLSMHLFHLVIANHHVLWIP
jgi:hypothetical protein